MLGRRNREDRLFRDAELGQYVARFRVAVAVSAARERSGTVGSGRSIR